MLIVDDSLFVRVVIKDILQKNNYEVVAEAANGEEAIEKYKEFLPDIITMDITMPIKNGIVASEEILAINPKTNIIIISALGQQDCILNLLKLGVKDYIFKPLNPELLLSALNFLF